MMGFVGEGGFDLLHNGADNRKYGPWWLSPGL